MERRRGRRRFAPTPPGVIDYGSTFNASTIPSYYYRIAFVGLLLSCSFCSSVINTKEKEIVEILNTVLPDIEFLNGTFLNNFTSVPYDIEQNGNSTTVINLLSPANKSLNESTVEITTENFSEIDTLKSSVINILNSSEHTTMSPHTAITADEDSFDVDIGTSIATPERTQIIETVPTTMTFSISATSAIATNLMESVVGSKVSAAVEISNVKQINVTESTSTFSSKLQKNITTTATSTSTKEMTKSLKFKTTKTPLVTTNATPSVMPSVTTVVATTKAAKPATTTTIHSTTSTVVPPTITSTTMRTTTTTTAQRDIVDLYNKEQIEMSFEITSIQELRDYKRELNQILHRIEKELFLREGYKTKHFTPIATNLPKKISSMFLQKIGAALNISPTGSDRNELNKKLLSLVLPQSSAEPGLQPLPDYPNIESFMLAATANSAANNRRFNPTKNHSADECKRLSQTELVDELKQRGTYNPDLMAWDVSGVLSFLDRSIADQYERQIKSQKSSKQAVQRNVDALERLLAELNLHCNVSTPEVIAKLSNLTLTEPRRSIMSPSIRLADDEIRYKRNIAEDLIHSFNRSHRHDSIPNENKKQKMIGEAHVVPFGCDRRGEIEDGYLRLCGACQAIRKLPDDFFPPFINEVTCDEDKSCLYFYEYPHGKCKQRHMNFVVLRNMGTQDCQVWQKHNLNVRVSCECFVDEMSFFAKYV